METENVLDELSKEELISIIKLYQATVRTLLTEKENIQQVHEIILGDSYDKLVDSVRSLEEENEKLLATNIFLLEQYGNWEADVDSSEKGDC